MSNALVDALQIHINNNDSHSFLEQYLIFILEGQTLNLPQSKNPEEIPNEWEEVLPTDCKIHQEFYKKLAITWINLIQRVPTHSDKDPVLELILTLQGIHAPSTPSAQELEEGAIGASTSADYKSLISTYTDERSAQELKASLPELIKQNKPYTFLKTYLQLHLTYPEISIPKSTLTEANMIYWNEIFKSLECKDPKFIQKVAGIYLNLVHTVGYPNSPDIVEKQCVKIDQLKQD